jgi:ATP-dependent Clp protease ATP-binding subunit ClpA
MNRLDKIVVFRSLGDPELRRILDLELARVQQRVFNGTPFLIQLSAAAKNRLLHEGTDAQYGARHLKRAIERTLVYPMANLIATRQVRTGDVVEVDFDADGESMIFERTEEGVSFDAMIQASGLDLPEMAGAQSAAIEMEYQKTANARGISRK